MVGLAARTVGLERENCTCRISLCLTLCLPDVTKKPRSLSLPGLPVNPRGTERPRYCYGSPEATLIGTVACPVPAVKWPLRSLADQPRRVVRPHRRHGRREEKPRRSETGPGSQIFLTTAATF